MEIKLNVNAIPDSSIRKDKFIKEVRNSILDKLKTINGESIVGEGDIIIESGSSNNSAYPEINHGTSDTTFTLTTNTLHKWDEVTELTLTLGDENPGVVNEYLIQFTSGAIPTVLTLPKDIKWSTPLKISKNKIYQISIVDNLATFAEFNALNTPQITLYITEQDTQEAGGGMEIINPDMINQLQTLCNWIIDNEHTGEDIDNKIAELEGFIPSETSNVIPGVIYDDGFLIINFPPEYGLPELIYGFGIRMSAVQPGAPENMYGLIPNDLMNNPILGTLDLDTGNLIFQQ